MSPSDEVNDDEATNDYSTYWQSIPDPPTPTPASLPEKIVTAADTTETRRRKRRDSLAPLKDVTNHALLRGNSYDGTRQKIMKSDVWAVNSYLSELEGCDDGDLLHNKRAKKSRRSSLLIDDEVDVLTDSLNVRTGTVLKTNTAAAATPRNVQAAAYQTRHAVKSSNDSSMLVQLVRKYCSLPLNRRVNSREAKEIESISGYPMPGKILDIFDGDIEACKREFLLRAQPIILAMEQQKQKDIDNTRSYTQCEVKKNPREVGFHYVDVKSSKPVSSEEYKARYYAMIHERRAERWQARTAASNGMDEPSADENVSSFGDDSNGDMDDSMMSIDNSLMNADNQTVASRNSSPCSTIDNGGTQPLANNLLPAQKNPTPAHSNVDTDVSSKASPTLHAQSKTVERQLLASVVPPSNDPRVIEARRKLFVAIDTALSNYSREILALKDQKE